MLTCCTQQILLRDPNRIVLHIPEICRYLGLETASPKRGHTGRAALAVRLQAWNCGCSCLKRNRACCNALDPTNKKLAHASREAASSESISNWSKSRIHILRYTHATGTQDDGYSWEATMRRVYRDCTRKGDGNDSKRKSHETSRFEFLSSGHH